MNNLAANRTPDRWRTRLRSNAEGPAPHRARRRRWLSMPVIVVAIGTVLGHGVAAASERGDRSDGSERTGSEDLPLVGISIPDEIRLPPRIRRRLFVGSREVGFFTPYGFHYTHPNAVNPGPFWQIPIRLVNVDGDVFHSRYSRCGRDFVLSPAPPEDAHDMTYWFTDGSDFTVESINDDRALPRMNNALASLGLDPDNAGSWGAPLAADGSADRLVWYHTSQGLVSWIATFNEHSNEFSTVWGDPHIAPSTDSNYPSHSFIDLDQDGNLESVWRRGDRLRMYEWATGEETWSTELGQCADY